MSVSTHVLDSTSGRPASSVRVRLVAPGGVDAGAVTDADGRVTGLETPSVGTYRLVFDTGAHFAGLGVPAFYPEVVVTFEVTDVGQHHHVPLLLSPFAYSTYRGS